MGHFISWTILCEGTPEELVLFMKDKDIETKEAMKLMEESGSGSDVLGHDFLAAYYQISRNSFPHIECMDTSNSKNFPQKIVDCIRNGGMNNLMRYVPVSQLFSMLTQESQTIKQEPATQPAQTNYESRDFKPGITRSQKDKILNQLDRIITNKEAQYLEGPGNVWTHKRDIGNITAHFRWTQTQEGYYYWNDIANNILINTYQPETPRDYIPMTYENFLELWKNPNNRLKCWRPVEQTETAKPKHRRTRKTKSAR
jgi:hypothetical protein